MLFFNRPTLTNSRSTDKGKGEDTDALHQKGRGDDHGCWEDDEP